MGNARFAIWLQYRVRANYRFPAGTVHGPEVRQTAEQSRSSWRERLVDVGTVRRLAALAS